MKKIIFFLIAMFVFFNSKAYAGGYEVEYETPTLGTAIGDLTRDVASIPGNVISGTFGGLIDGFSGKRRTYRTRVVVPSYDGWNSYRPYWLNGPYVQAGYPAAIGVPVYPPQVVERVVVVEKKSGEEQKDIKPSVVISNVNSNNTVNNFYGDKVVSTAITAASASEPNQAPTKKIKKARRIVHHPKGNF